MEKKHAEVAIAGIGLIPWGLYPEKSMAEIATEATLIALKNANMEWREIETIVAGAYHWIAEKEGMSGLLMATSIGFLMGSIGVPVVNVANACATSQSILREAYFAIASGEYDVALAVAGDKSSGGFFRPQSTDSRFDLDYQRYVMTGETNPAYWAMEARRRMHDVGTTEDDLAMVKVVTSKGAPHNPYTRYKRVFTKEEVLNSPMVCDPLHLYEICATSDGAAAIILTSLDKAKKYTNKPVLIEGVTVASSTFGDQTIPLFNLSTFPRPGVPALTESRTCIKSLYKRTNRRPEDLDIIELPDNSSWHYLAYLDCILGLGPQEAEKMLRRGDTDPIDGKIPVCTGGGAGASGESIAAQGLYFLCEAVEQLRGEAGLRQVKKEAKVALAQTYGYAGNNSACIVSRAW
jgi:acetyl-CoA acetyltransferase